MTQAAPPSPHGHDRRSRGVASVDLLAAMALGTLLVLCALLIADAGLRLGDGNRIHGLRDLEEFLFAVIIAACFPISVVRREHIRVRLWSHRGGAALGRRMDTFGDCCLLVLFTALAGGLGWLATDWWRAGRWTATLQYPLAPWVALSAVLLAWAALLQARVCLQRLRPSVPVEEPAHGS